MIFGVERINQKSKLFYKFVKKKRSNFVFKTPKMNLSKNEYTLKKKRNKILIFIQLITLVFIKNYML